MSYSTRRDFLARSAGLGWAALTFSDRLWAQSLPAAVQGADTPPDMTVVGWPGQIPGDNLAKVGQPAPAGTFARLTQTAISALGGMSRFVKRGDIVWIKPNIGWNRTPELAANTHPDVVAELVKLCLGAGAKKVKVGDYTCNDPKQSYENSGIAPAAKAAGADIVYLEKSRFRDMKIGGNRLKDHPVYPEIVECDLVINVPVCKHHSATTVTLCMKNYMGVVEKRRTFHQDLPTTIADITQFMKPRLCVLDATRVLKANGPTGGDPDDVQFMNTVAAGVDIVALDAYGCELLGHKPSSIGTVKMGEEYRLGTSDWRKLVPRRLSVE